jgi:hypothetical protein
MKRKILGILGALALTLPFLLALGGGTANAADCYHTFHARPTAPGWYSDPCGAKDYSSDGFVTAAVRVQFFWETAGGPHITYVRGTQNECLVATTIGNRVRAEATALHRVSDFAEYASSIQGTIETSNCAMQITVNKAVRGCGSTDAPIGTHAYQSYTEARGSFVGSDGRTVREPATGYFTTPFTYFRSVTAGAAC